ncbi:uncharacterized protein LOC128557606 [Mercenaria mercenaria]|uniref:uncharacterized protein LOC128557606 n=1 Tax=Mercenaria mercenaria TaxID=6596 RepID=UPI00234F9971|nr:uncharacterized protein LOC128557606 [Mercenaria mercenaria]
MWGDVKLGFDSATGTEYLEYNERQTKTRTGIDPSNIRRQKPRMYATGTDRCPVETYKVYAKQRPENFSGDEDPFYLAVVTHTRTPAVKDQWFLRGPIGRNKLNNLLKSMAAKADLPELQFGKRITNTSVRKRLCQKLLENEVPDTHAVHVTGHKKCQFTE